MAGFLIPFGRAVNDTNDVIDKGRLEQQQEQLKITGNDLRSQLLKQQLLKQQLLKQQLGAGGLDPKVYLKFFLENAQKKLQFQQQAAGLRQQGDDYWNAGDRDTASRYYQWADMAESGIPIGTGGSASGVIKDPFGQFLNYTSKEGQISQQQQKAYNDWLIQKQNSETLGTPDPGPPPAMAPMPDLGGSPSSPKALPYGYGGAPLGVVSSPTGHYAPGAPAPSGALPGPPGANTRPTTPGVVDAVRLGSDVAAARTALGTGGPAVSGGPAISRSFPGYSGPSVSPVGAPPGVGNKLPYYSMSDLHALEGSPSPQVRQAAKGEIASRQKNKEPGTKDKLFLDQTHSAIFGAQRLIEAVASLGHVSAWDLHENARSYYRGELTSMTPAWQHYFTAVGDTYRGLYQISQSGRGGKYLAEYLDVHFPHGADRWFPDWPSLTAHKVQQLLLDPHWSSIQDQRNQILKRQFEAENGKGATYVSPETSDALRDHVSY